MVETAANRVARHLKERVGDDLRTVVIVKPDTHEITHLSSELQREYSEEEPERFNRVVSRFVDSI